MRFYAERDTAPEKWYPRSAGGVPMKFDDLPPEYRKNVDEEPPFGRRAGEAPALTDEDVRDIVAFLNALSDGYAPDPGHASPTTVIRVSH